jgi:hypothetical protein
VTVEMERWRCPRCDAEQDVWLTDGEPDQVDADVLLEEGVVRVNRNTKCAACFADSKLVALQPAAESDR